MRRKDGQPPAKPGYGERAAYAHTYYLLNKKRYKKYREEQKERRRERALEWRYGIGPEQMARLLLLQGNACAICRYVFDGVGKQGIPHLDHAHDSKEIRGILCNNCNRSVGGFKDNPDTLRAAIAYLANPPARAILAALPTQLKLVDESA